MAVLDASTDKASGVCQVFIDGQDISDICRYADEEQGVAFCILKIGENRRCYAYTNDLPAEWENFNTSDCWDKILLYERRGRVEIVRQT